MTKIKPKSVDVIDEKNSFGEAWRRGLRHIKMFGKPIEFGTEKELKYATDVCLIVSLTENALSEAISGKFHPQFPTRQKMRDGYIREWDRDYDWKSQGFTYCYEDRAEAYQGFKKEEIRLQHADFPNNEEMGFDSSIFKNRTIDQWKLAKEDLSSQISTGISSNRNVIVIGNPSIDRFEIPDSPPCLRELFIRLEGFEDGTPICSAHWVFRSRDFGIAWPTNITGILSAIHREVLIPNKAKLNQVIDISHSAHVYRGDYDLFDTVK
jgi:thymidylate synthase